MSFKNFLLKNKTVTFLYSSTDTLFYKCGEIIFSIPISDTGDGEFKHNDKSLYFIRWLKPIYDKLHIQEYIEFIAFKKNEYWFKYKDITFPIHINDIKDLKIYEVNNMSPFFEKHINIFNQNVIDERLKYE